MQSLWLCFKSVIVFVICDTVMKRVSPNVFYKVKVVRINDT